MATPRASDSSALRTNDRQDGGCGGRRQKFRRRDRLCRKREFEAVLRRGMRVTDHRLIVWACANDGGPPRLGLIVGRRVGNAPARNRAKRLLREAFRLTRHELPPGQDLICSPVPGADLSLPSAIQSLVNLAGQLARRAARRRARANAAPDGAET